jgi:hypothetical protein
MELSVAFAMESWIGTLHPVQNRLPCLPKSLITADSRISYLGQSDHTWLGSYLY